MSKEEFVPYHEPGAKDVARYHAVPQTERGGFRIRLEEKFSQEEALENLLRKDERVLLVRYEEGRWYSNGEEGPAWYQFHVGCRKVDTQILIGDMENRISEELGTDVRGQIWFED